MIVASRFLRDRRRSFVGWSIAAVGLVLMTVAFFPAIRDQPSLDDLFREMPAGLRATLGVAEGVSLGSPAGYLQGRLFSITLPLALVIFGVALGARAMGGFEEDGQLEVLLANPLRRERLIIERFAATLALVVALGGVFTTLLLVMAPPLGAIEGLPVVWVIAACFGGTALALFHGALAFTIGAATGRRGPAIAGATTVAVGGYLAHGLFAAANAPEGVRLVSPWYWYLRHNMLIDGPDVVALVLPVVCSVVLLAGAVYTFARRDLR